MASPLINNVSRQHVTHANGLQQNIGSFATALFTQGAAPVINKIDTKLDIETLTNESGIAPLIKRMLGYDKDGEVIMPSESAVSEYIYALTGHEVAVPAQYKDKRAPGEDLYPDATSEQVKMMRLDWALKNVTSKALRNAVRRANISAWELFSTGEMTIADKHEGVNKLVFPRSGTLKNVTVTANWNTPASAKPWTDYGKATKLIAEEGEFGGSYEGFSVLGNTAFNELQAAYRSQRPQDIEPTLYKTYSFVGEAPSNFKFLVDNGLSYRGYIVDDENTTVHLFTSNEYYVDDAGDKTRLVSDDSVTISLYNAFDYKAFFGPGTKLADGDDGWYKRTFDIFGGMGDMNVPLPGEYYNSGVPIEAFDNIFYPLGKASGIGGSVEIAYLFALLNANTVATLDIRTV